MTENPPMTKLSLRDDLYAELNLLTNDEGMIVINNGSDCSAVDTMITVGFCAIKWAFPVLKRGMPTTLISTHPKNGCVIT